MASNIAIVNGSNNNSSSTFTYGVDLRVGDLVLFQIKIDSPYGPGGSFNDTTNQYINYYSNSTNNGQKFANYFSVITSPVSANTPITFNSTDATNIYLFLMVFRPDSGEKFGPPIAVSATTNTSPSTTISTSFSTPLGPAIMFASTGVKNTTSFNFPSDSSGNAPWIPVYYSSYEGMFGSYKISQQTAPQIYNPTFSSSTAVQALINYPILLDVSTGGVKSNGRLEPLGTFSAVQAGAKASGSINLTISQPVSSRVNVISNSDTIVSLNAQPILNINAQTNLNLRSLISYNLNLSINTTSGGNIVAPSIRQNLVQGILPMQAQATSNANIVPSFISTISPIRGQANANGYFDPLLSNTLTSNLILSLSAKSGLKENIGLIIAIPSAPFDGTWSGIKSNAWSNPSLRIAISNQAATTANANINVSSPTSALRLGINAISDADMLSSVNYTFGINAGMASNASIRTASTTTLDASGNLIAVGNAAEKFNFQSRIINLLSTKSNINDGVSVNARIINSIGATSTGYSDPIISSIQRINISAQASALSGGKENIRLITSFINVPPTISLTDNLIQDGTFDTGGVLWKGINNTVSVINNNLQVNSSFQDWESDPIGPLGAYQTFNATVGYKYQLSASVYNSTGNTPRDMYVQITWANGQVSKGTITPVSINDGWVNLTVSGLAETTGTATAYIVTSTPFDSFNKNDTALIDNVSVYAIGIPATPYISLTANANGNIISRATSPISVRLSGIAESDIRLGIISRISPLNAQTTASGYVDPLFISNFVLTTSGQANQKSNANSIISLTSTVSSTVNAIGNLAERFNFQTRIINVAGTTSNSNIFTIVGQPLRLSLNALSNGYIDPTINTIQTINISAQAVATSGAKENIRLITGFINVPQTVSFSENYIQDGTFDLGGSLWRGINNTISIVNNNLQINSSVQDWQLEPVGPLGAYQTFNAVVGYTYQLSASVQNSVGTNPRNMYVQITWSNGQISKGQLTLINILDGWVNLTVSGVAQSSGPATAYIVTSTPFDNINTGDVALVDNVSVYAIAAPATPYLGITAKANGNIIPRVISPIPAQLAGTTGLNSVIGINARISPLAGQAFTTGYIDPQIPSIGSFNIGPLNLNAISGANVRTLNILPPFAATATATSNSRELFNFQSRIVNSINATTNNLINPTHRIILSMQANGVVNGYSDPLFAPTFILTTSGTAGEASSGRIITSLIQSDISATLNATTNLNIIIRQITPLNLLAQTTTNNNIVPLVSYRLISSAGLTSSGYFDPLNTSQALTISAQAGQKSNAQEKLSLIQTFSEATQIVPNTDNQLQDSSFELGSTYWFGINNFISVVNDSSYDGLNSLKVYGYTNYYQEEPVGPLGAGQRFNAIGGRTYQFEAYVNNVSGKTPRNMYVAIQWNPGLRSFGTVIPVAIADGWVKLSLTAVAPTSGPSVAYIITSTPFDSQAGDISLIDNVSLYITDSFGPIPTIAAGTKSNANAITSLPNTARARLAATSYLSEFFNFQTNIINRVNAVANGSILSINNITLPPLTINANSNGYFDPLRSPINISVLQVSSIAANTNGFIRPSIISPINSAISTTTNLYANPSFITRIINSVNTQSNGSLIATTANTVLPPLTANAISGGKYPQASTLLVFNVGAQSNANSALSTNYRFGSSANVTSFGYAPDILSANTLDLGTIRAFVNSTGDENLSLVQGLVTNYPPIISGNILLDSSFSQGSLYWNGIANVIQFTTDYSYSGSQSLLIKVPDVSDPEYIMPLGASQQFTAIAGRNYTFSAYVRNLVGDTRNMSLRLQWANKATSESKPKLISQADGWTKLEFTASAASNGPAVAYIITSNAFNPFITDVSVIDEVVLTVTDAPPVTINIVSSGTGNIRLGITSSPILIANILTNGRELFATNYRISNIAGARSGADLLSTVPPINIGPLNASAKVYGTDGISVVSTFKIPDNIGDISINLIADSNAFIRPRFISVLDGTTANITTNTIETFRHVSRINAVANIQSSADVITSSGQPLVIRPLTANVNSSGDIQLSVGRELGFLNAGMKSNAFVRAGITVSLIPGERVNLIRNGSFEQGTKYWNSISNYNKISVGDAYEGTQCIYITDNDWGNSGIWQEFNAFAGANYTFSAYVKNVTGLDPRSMQLQISWADGTVSASVPKLIFHDDGWVRLELVTQAGRGKSGQATATIIVSSLPDALVESNAVSAVDAVVLTEESFVSDYFENPNIIGTFVISKGNGRINLSTNNRLTLSANVQSNGGFYQTPTPLLLNTDFEEGTRYWSSVNNNINATTDYVLSGTQAIILTALNTFDEFPAGPFGISQNFKAYANRRYTVSAYVKNISGVDPRSMYAQIRWANATSSIGVIKSVATTDDWTLVQVSAICPTEGFATVQILTSSPFGGINGQDIAVIDSVGITEEFVPMQYIRLTGLSGGMKSTGFVDPLVSTVGTYNPFAIGVANTSGNASIRLISDISGTNASSTINGRIKETSTFNIGPIRAQAQSATQGNLQPFNAGIIIPQFSRGFVVSSGSISLSTEFIPIPNLSIKTNGVVRTSAIFDISSIAIAESKATGRSGISSDPGVISQLVPYEIRIIGGSESFGTAILEFGGTGPIFIGWGQPL